MKCIDPVLCFDREKKRIFRNWSIAKTSVFLRGVKPTFVYHCGKCLVCRKRRSIELAARCVLHASLYPNNCFLTLTYDEKKEGYHNVLSYRDIQLFKKRLRSHVQRSESRRIDVFNVHEYGKNGKKHWHLIVFNYKPQDCELHTTHKGNGLYTSPTLSKLWPDGFHTIGDVSEASAMYQAQYMEKDFKNNNVTNGKKSVSRHSGLGKPFFLKNYEQLLRLGYIPFSGRKLPLPRYFQKLAHKHWCHFNEPSAFFDTPYRKRLYTPFKVGQENKRISDLFTYYTEMKKQKIIDYEKEFDELIESYLGSKLVTQFEQSGSNLEYDRSKQITHERF